MAALTANRNTPRLGDHVIPDVISKPIADNVHIYQGALVVQSGAYVKPGAAGPGLVALGIALDECDNTVVGHAAGALNVPIRSGVFKFDNSANADAIAAANEGADCYVVDDHTVALTDGGNGARSRAGKIVQVDSDGVWVEVGLVAKDEAPKILSFPIDLASIPNGAGPSQVIAALVVPYGGKIKSIQFLVNAPAITAAKAATLQPQITPAGGAAASTTGGAVALTSANCTPMGALVAGSAITAANSFKAGDSIGVVASAVTAFGEGSGSLLLTIAPA